MSEYAAIIGLALGFAGGLCFGFCAGLLYVSLRNPTSDDAPAAHTDIH